MTEPQAAPPIRGEIQPELGGHRDPREYSEVLKQMRQNNRVMSAFLVRPEGVSVEIQDEDEQILLLVREHFITNMPWIGFAIFLGLLPGLFTLMPLWGVLPARFQIFGMLMWGMLVLTVVIEGFLSWYFDVFVVTNKRVVDVDFRNLIYKNITSATIEHIQDVTYNVGGPLASLLDYGSVLVQTASGVPMIEIPNTPHPAKVAKLIDEMMMQIDEDHHGGV